MLNNPIKTIEQAKEYFQSMGCSHFHMSRENYQRYAEYRLLNIPDQIEEEWLKESFEKYYANIMENTDYGLLWNLHSNMYDLVETLQTNASLRKMLEVTKHISDKVPIIYRVIVAETINGRTARQARRGLIYISYDMGKITTAREFVELSMFFSEYKDNEIDETALNQLYGGIPLQILEPKDYESRHLARCQKATNQCMEIKRELGL